jgi:hypothetical protein
MQRSHLRGGTFSQKLESANSHGPHHRFHPSLNANSISVSPSIFGAAFPTATPEELSDT